MKNYCSAEELESAILQSFSYMGLLRRLGINYSYSKVVVIKQMIEELGFSTEHFLGQAQGRGKKLLVKRRRSRVQDSEIFCLNSRYCGARAGVLRARMLKRGWPYLCANEVCPTREGGVWLGSPITLQVDHINGVPSDNREENLRFLCPNCHSQTPTYMSRNVKRQRMTFKCEDCGCPISGHGLRRYCRACSFRRRLPGHAGFIKRKVEWPTDSHMRRLVETCSMRAIAAWLGATESAVRVHCARRGIKPAGYPRRTGTPE